MLDLRAQPQHHFPMSPCQPHTAPIAGPSNGAGDAFGLGISSNGGGSCVGPARIVSTPMPAATAALAHAVRDHRHNIPSVPNENAFEQPSPPPVREPPVDHRAHPMHHSSMRREFARDPFAPMPDEFTYKGAALRRLERTHIRGTSSGGDASESLASRKRALTAPSSLEPPLPKRSMRTGSGATSPETPYDPATPTEPRHHIGNRSTLLGESPVSSLRSSLFARAAPSQPMSFASSSSSSLVSGAARQLAGDDSRHRVAANVPEPIPEHDADPSVASRKRRHSSAAARPRMQVSPPDNALSYDMMPIEESPSSPRSSSSFLDPAGGPSPQPNDALFPPIDSGSR
ncbi:hypothetical protein IWW38_001351 [Coemansia aciculifera]|uniref:Uncharacterized protein n=1 Tax=Coemansia aciculifera TaxID=417176 RepID=A0ACC1M6J6_9FUNG|nr:hypothetical protein IWW38_001351 [Coemansia aciculifera]